MKFNLFQDTESLKKLLMKENWKLCIFEELLVDDTKNAVKIKKENYLESGLYAVIDQGQKFVGGYSNIEEGMYKNNGVIIFGDHTKILKYIDFPIYLGADGVKLLVKLRHSPEIDIKYIYYYLNTVILPSDGYSRHFKYLKDTIIPIPSVLIQKKIVEILDKSQELIEKRKEQIEACNELINSLFYEMFGDPIKNSKHFEIFKFGEVVANFKYGTNEKSYDTFHVGSIPVLRIPNILPCKIDLTDLKFSLLNMKEKRVNLLERGDLLFVRTNGNPEYIGRCATYNLSGEWAFASYLIRARLKPDVSLESGYLQFLFSFNTFRQRFLRESKTTAGNYNINTEGLKGLEIISPPIKIQRLFIERIKKVQHQLQIFEKSLTELENNFNALMQKAFKGELL